jgi:hypothetical protein
VTKPSPTLLGPRVTSSRHWRDEWLKRFHELREILRNHLPDDVLVHAEIVVHDLVSHSDDVVPGDLGMGRRELA